MGMMEAQPCPANNPNCDAQLYSAGQFVFCPKCKLPNPNYSRVTAAVARETHTIAGKQPVVDIKAGIIKWR